jgi:hypothetical protein
MPTFIDESGDTGPCGKGGKPYFRLAAVWVPTLDVAEAFRAAVRQLRHDNGLRTDYEFKYVKTHSQLAQRRAFLDTALQHEFRFTACSIDKTSDDWKPATGQAMHWACATALAVQLRSIYHAREEEQGPPLREPVVVDDNEDGNFLATIKRAFRGLESRSQPGSSLVGPVTFRKSAPEEMLHLADMVCGAVGAYLDGTDLTWYRLIEKRDLKTFRLP